MRIVERVFFGRVSLEGNKLCVDGQKKEFCVELYRPLDEFTEEIIKKKVSDVVGVIRFMVKSDNSSFSITPAKLVLPEISVLSPDVPTTGMFVSIGKFSDGWIDIPSYDTLENDGFAVMSLLPIIFPRRIPEKVRDALLHDPASISLHFHPDRIEIEGEIMNDKDRIEKINFTVNEPMSDLVKKYSLIREIVDARKYKESLVEVDLPKFSQAIPVRIKRNSIYPKGVNFGINVKEEIPEVGSKEFIGYLLFGVTRRGNILDVSLIYPVNDDILLLRDVKVNALDFERFLEKIFEYRGYSLHYNSLNRALFDETFIPQLISNVSNMLRFIQPSTFAFGLDGVLVFDNKEYKLEKLLDSKPIFKKE